MRRAPHFILKNKMQVCDFVIGGRGGNAPRRAVGVLIACVRVCVRVLRLLGNKVKAYVYDLTSLPSLSSYSELLKVYVYDLTCLLPSCPRPHSY